MNDYNLDLQKLFIEFMVKDSRFICESERNM